MGVNFIIVGVPQGSILGTFSFLIYINILTLPVNLSDKLTLYAEGTTGVVKSKTTDELKVQFVKP